jgi:hypothetical protein
VEVRYSTSSNTLKVENSISENVLLANQTLSFAQSRISPEKYAEVREFGKILAPQLVSRPPSKYFRISWIRPEVPDALLEEPPINHISTKNKY